MKRWLLGAVAAASMTVAAAGPGGDAEAGRVKSDDARCQECHGESGHADNGDGVGNLGKFPKLAGQHADYIVKQVRDFRAGRRSNETMNQVAARVDDAELADIAAYFSTQRPMEGDGAAGSAAGRRLFHDGIPERGIPPCAGCHGANGRGAAGAAIPVVGGQHKRYLVKQLTEWRAGIRANSPGSVMNDVARRLNDEDIETLADYAAGL